MEATKSVKQLLQLPLEWKVNKMNLEETKKKFRYIIRRFYC